MNETNREPLAVALQYDGDSAPRVTAKGYDALAERIVDLAREHDIPIQENAVLARLLSRVELNEEIPEELYLSVAQVIAFAYRLSGRDVTGARGAGATGGKLD